jgi:hypothetical protein
MKAAQTNKLDLNLSKDGAKQETLAVLRMQVSTTIPEKTGSPAFNQHVMMGVMLPACIGWWSA